MNFLPVDVISDITSFIESDALYRLWSCGDKALNFRLEQGGVAVVKYVAYYDLEKMSTIKIPLFLRHFNQLRHLIILPVSALRIDSEYAQKMPTLAPESLGGLPSTLRAITVLGQCRTPHDRPHFPASIIFKAYENLHSLSGITTIQSDGINEFSNRLRRISVSEWSIPDFSQISFPSLTSLHIREKIKIMGQPGSNGTSQRLDFTFPPNLIDLWIPPKCDKEFSELEISDLPVIAKWMIPTWPAHLERLTVEKFFAPFWDIPRFDAFLARSLPSSLTVFHLEQHSVHWEVSDDFLAQLPRGLRSLRLPPFVNDLSALPPDLTRITGFNRIIRSSELDQLPPNITDLSICPTGSLDGSELCQRLKRLSIVVTQRTTIEDLPDSITYLCVDAPSSFFTLQRFPESLKIVKLKLNLQQPLEANLSSLPQDVHTLDLDFRQQVYTSNFLSLIPRQLKHFAFLGVLNDSLLAENVLPPCLVSLSITAAYSAFYTLTSQCFKNLPRTLIALRIGLLKLDPSELSDLPPALQVAHIGNNSHGSLPISLPLSLSSSLSRTLRFLFLDWRIQNLSEFAPLVPNCCLKDMEAL